MLHFPFADVSKLDENNYLITLKRVSPSKSLIVEVFNQLEILSKTRDKHLLIDLSNMIPLDRQSRQLIDAYLERITDRIAFFSSNEMGIMMARLYQKLLRARCTFEVFNEKEEAIAWLRLREY
ncbi:MAG: STAS/SEC14 domain-containing protein [Crocinitomicaceae bacterium]|jgi:hypothetical protein|nr:STAS/SEC14 domain-containing protein [Crocinitomicaceae bacterium]